MHASPLFINNVIISNVLTFAWNYEIKHNTLRLLRPTSLAHEFALCWQTKCSLTEGSTPSKTLYLKDGVLRGVELQVDQQVVVSSPAHREHKQVSVSTWEC